MRFSPSGSFVFGVFLPGSGDCGAVTVLWPGLFLCVLKEHVSISQIMANEALLLRAQVRVHQVDQVLFFFASATGKVVSIAALFEWHKIVAVQRLSHLSMFTL
jgi:hypothetical protein